MDITSLIAHLPKTELHLHIEGTLEPELMWQLANKHDITLPFKDVEAIKQAYQFENLQSFLDLYYQGADVLRDEKDFYLLMQAYLLKCKQDNVVHTEIMFDPQTHTARGIAFNVFMAGLKRAIDEAQADCGISVYLILSFLRHLSEADAFQTLTDAAPFYADIKAVGLDSSELGNPPQKFKNVYARARDLGFKLVAHAGEEGPADYIWQALNDLKVARIDHGVRSAEDPALLDYLSKHQIPLTVCPLSNLKLCVVNDLAEHNILRLLEGDLCVTVNSDDPSYFGGYVNANYIAIAHSLCMSKSQLVTLVKNSFVGSFLPNNLKNDWIKKVDEIANTD